MASYSTRWIDPAGNTHYFHGLAKTTFLFDGTNVETALSNKANIIKTYRAAEIPPLPNQHLLEMTEAADLVGDLTAERLELERRVGALEEVSISSGTWTPELMDTSGNADVTYGVRRGCWAKNGKLVHIEAAIGIADIGSLAGNLSILLPTELYRASTNYYPGGYCMMIYVTPPDGVSGPVSYLANADRVSIGYMHADAAGRSVFYQLRAEDVRTNAQIRVVIDYMGD